jgi:lactoylglutathione lyase
MKTVAPFEVGLVVTDIDRLLPFYRDLLGLAVIGDVEVPAERSRPSGLAADGYRVVRLESDSGDRLKLARASRAGAPTAAAGYAMERPGTAYVTFIVDDLVGLHRRLTQAGAQIRSAGVVTLRSGLRLLLAVDPEGNFIELLQYDDVSAYRRPASGVPGAIP